MCTQTHNEMVRFEILIEESPLRHFRYTNTKCSRLIWYTVLLQRQSQQRRTFIVAGIASHKTALDAIDFVKFNLFGKVFRRFEKWLSFGLK